MSAHDQVKEFLTPHLVALGFEAPTTFVRTLKSGSKEPTRMRWRAPDTLGFGDDLRASVEAYVADCYPDKRGEVFLHAWNCIGSDVRARDIVAELKARGVDCRSTSRKTYKGIAIKLPSFDWNKT